MASMEAPPADDVRRGYRFWGVVIVAILAVELAGALRNWMDDYLGVTIPWTTISEMVGHLEELWPPAAVFVIAIIAPAAFYALAPLDLKPEHRSDLGRLYIRSSPDEPVRWYRPWLVFLLSAIVGVIAIRVADDDFTRGDVVYGALFFFGIGVPSILVLIVHSEVGFTSLVFTVRHLRRRRNWKAWLATVGVSAGLAILVIHLAFYPWPDITTEPVRYAGLTERQARMKATRQIEQSASGGIPLVYSTQTRGVVIARKPGSSSSSRRTDPTPPASST